MGFHVSTLAHLPRGGIRYWIYVVDVSDRGVHSDWIKADLTKLGASVGSDVGLVTGPAELSQELFEYLHSSLASADDFCALEALLHGTTCLVVSEGHLHKTPSSVYLIPVAGRGHGEAEREFVTATLTTVSEDLAAGERLQEAVVSQHGAREFRLKNRQARLLVCLQWINRTIELKPKVAGVGINLNAVIEAILSAIDRAPVRPGGTHAD